MSFRTQSQVDRLRLPEGRTDAYVFDGEQRGLSVRLQGRSRTWVVHFQANGKRRRITLGNVAGLSLRQARVEASRIVGAARAGEDELAKRSVARHRDALAFRAMAEEFLMRRGAELRPSTLAGYRYQLLVQAAPLHALPLEDIRRADIVRVLDVVADESGLYSANRLRSAISAVWAWAMKRGAAESNPVVGSAKPLEKEQERSRRLTPEELRTVWAATDGTDAFGQLARLLLLTGMRRGEAGGLRWSEVHDLDLPGRVRLELPSERLKQGRRMTEPLALPLSEAAADILRARRAALPEKAVYVFGAKGRTAYTGWSAAIKRLAVRAELPGLRLHDIRRTVRSGLGALSVPPHVAERALGHLPPKLVRTYDRHDYQGEIRDAMESWAAWLTDVVEGREANIVTLRA
jgi:integrase